MKKPIFTFIYNHSSTMNYFIHTVLDIIGNGLLHYIYSAFSKTRLPPELRRVLSCESLAAFLHFPLEEKGSSGPLLSAPAGASKRETPTSNLTESTVYIHNLWNSHTVRQACSLWVSHLLHMYQNAL